MKQQGRSTQDAHGILNLKKKSLLTPSLAKPRENSNFENLFIYKGTHYITGKDKVHPRTGHEVPEGE